MTLTKKKKAWLITAGSVLMTLLLVLSGLGVYFKISQRSNTNPAKVNPLDFSIDTWDGTAPTGTELESDFGGRGTTTRTISSALEFVQFVEEVNAGSTFENITVYLNKNIDLGNRTIDSIGSGTNSFKGTFDGSYYTIFNANLEGRGLFEKTEKATIKNLGLYNPTIDSASQYVGGLIGTAVNTEISNCYVNGGKISAPNAGGLVGEYIVKGNTTSINNPLNVKNKISNCFVDMMINANSVYGLVGHVTAGDDSANVLEIENSYFTNGVDAVDNATIVELVEVFKPENINTFKNSNFDYKAKYEDGAEWCDYNYLEGSKKLEFKWPVQSGFVKTFLTGSHYESVVVTEEGTVDISNLSDAFTEASKTEEAVVNLIVEKIFVEASAEAVTNSTIQVTAVNDTTLVRGENNVGSLFTAKENSKVVLGTNTQTFSDESVATIVLDGDRENVEKDSKRESDALVAAVGGTVEIHDNVILQNNVNTYTEYGGAILLNGLTEKPILNGTISNCSAGEYGGGICVIDSTIGGFGKIEGCRATKGGAVAIIDEGSVSESVAQKMATLYGEPKNVMPAASYEPDGSFPQLSYADKNEAAQGGAVYINTVTGTKTTDLTLFIAKVTFTRNHAQQGGAVYLGRVTTSASKRNVTINGKYSDNYVNGSNCGGGAIYVSGSNIKTLTVNGTYTNNYANSGGGGALYISSNPTSVTIAGTFSTTNSTDAYNGGAIYCVGTRTLTTNSAFTEFYAAGKGGAIYCTGALTISGTPSFNACAAEDVGGAIYASSVTLTGGTSTSSRMEFVDNISEGDGSCVYASGNVTINKYVYFNANATRGSNGGAIYSGGNVTLNSNANAQFDLNTSEDNAGAGDIFASNSVIISSGATLQIYDDGEAFYSIRANYVYIYGTFVSDDRYKAIYITSSNGFVHDDYCGQDLISADKYGLTAYNYDNFETSILFRSNEDLQPNHRYNGSQPYLLSNWEYDEDYGYYYEYAYIPKAYLNANWKIFFGGAVGAVSNIKSITFSSGTSVPSGYSTYFNAGAPNGTSTTQNTNLRLYYKTASSGGYDVTFMAPSGGEIYAPNNSSSLFSGCSGVTNFSGLRYLNTSNVTNMSAMFKGCSALQGVDIVNDTWNTSNVTNMSEMFSGCSSVTDIALYGLGTSSVTNTSNMFYGCTNLYYLDLQYLNFSSVTNSSEMLNLGTSNKLGEFYLPQNMPSGGLSITTGSYMSVSEDWQNLVVTSGVASTIPASLADSYLANVYKISIYTNGGTVGKNLVNLYRARGSSSSQVQSGSIKYYIDSQGKIIATSTGTSSDNCGFISSVTADVTANGTYTKKIWWSSSSASTSVDHGWFKDAAYSYYTFGSNGTSGYHSTSTSTLTMPSGNPFFAGKFTLRVDPNAPSNTMTVMGISLYKETTNTSYSIYMPSGSYLYYPLDVPTRTGYTFTGWTITNNTGGTLYNTSTTYKTYTYRHGGTGDTIISANWTPSNYTLTFNANTSVGDLLASSLWNYAGSTGYTSSNAGVKSSYTTGTTGVATKSQSYNGTLPTYAPIPIRRGYTFTGWYTATSGGSKIANADGSWNDVSGYTSSSKWVKAASTTLYAQWTATTYSITVNNNDGSSTTTSNYAVDLTRTISDPTRTGYTFAGWTITSSLRKMNKATINMGSGVQEYNGSYSLAVYYELFYISSAYTYTGTKATANSSGAEIRWRSFNASTGQYINNLSTDVTITGNNSNIAFWYHNGNNSSTTNVTITNKIKSFNTDTLKLTGNLTLTANWTPNTNTKYTVYHYLEDVNNSDSLSTSNCTLDSTQNLTGTTGASVTPAVIEYGGFTAPSTQTVTIKADGSTKVYYYYTRNQYTLTLNKDTGIQIARFSGTFDYGAQVILRAVAASGYTFSEWVKNSGSLTTHGEQYFDSKNDNQVVWLNSDVTLTATATPNADTAYTVNHWIENIDVAGTTYNSTQYTKHSTDNKTGTTDTSLTLTDLDKTITGFKYNLGQVGGTTVTSTTILGDGTRVIDLYYTRNSYTVSLTKGTGIASVTGAGTYDYGKEVTVSATVSAGYHTVAWSGTFTTSTFTMPASNVNMTATATPNTYTVVYNKNATNATGTMANSTHVYGTASNLTNNAFKNQYTITYSLNGGSLPAGKTTPETVAYTFEGWATTSTGDVAYSNGQSVSTLTTNDSITLYAKWTSKSTTLPTPVKTGYTFAGWYTANTSGTKIGDGNASYTPSANVTMYARWTNVTSTIHFDSSTEYLTQRNIGSYGASPSSTTNRIENGELITKIVMNAGENGAYVLGQGTKTVGTQYVWTIDIKVSETMAFKAFGVESGGTQSITINHSNDWQRFTHVYTCSSTSYKAFTFYRTSWSAGQWIEIKNVSCKAVSDITSDYPVAQRTVNYGEAYSSLPSPVKTGYNFLGWSYLPAGYTQLDYVTFSGGYIDTGITPTLNTNIDITFYATSVGSNWLFGSRTGYNATNTFALRLDNETQIWPQMGGVDPNSIAVSNYLNTKTRIVFNKNFLEFNGSSLRSNPFNISSFGSSSLNIFLGGLNNGGSLESRKFAGRIYEAKIYNGATLTAHFIPAKNSSGTLGMYDIVRKTFYPVSGSGATAGPENYITSSYVWNNIEEKTLYARYNVNTYYIAYNGNGSTSGSMTNSTATYNTNVTLKANTYARNGYTFAGWNTKADGSGTAYSDQASVRNLTSTAGGTATLFAQWTANTYTITYNFGNNTKLMNGSTVIADNKKYETTYTPDDNLTVYSAIKDYADFSGWNVYATTDSDSHNWSQSIAANALNIGKGLYGNVTLSIQYVWHTYTVIFNNDGASWINVDNATVKYNGTLSTIPTAEGVNYWSSQPNGSLKITTNTQFNIGTFGTIDTANRTFTVYAVLYKTNYAFIDSKFGLGSNIQGVKYNEDIVLPNLDETEGYKFLGWFSDPTGGTKIADGGSQYTNKETASVKNMYAQWEALPSYLNSDWKTLIGLETSQISSIEFVSGAEAPEGFTNKVEVGATSRSSTTVNSSVYAYKMLDGSNYKLAFVSPSGGTIYAPTNRSNLFSNLSALQTITFNNFDTSSVTYMISMFYNCSSLTSLNLSSFNTSSVTNMSYMFSSCSSLISLDLSSFNTSSVTNMSGMFANCSSLTSLALSRFNTSSVTNMSSMFQGCSSLTSLDLSSFRTSSVTTMSSMFSVCSRLTSLDLSSFNTSLVTNMSWMFSYCSSLKELNLSSFDLSKCDSVDNMLNLTTANLINKIQLPKEFGSCSLPLTTGSSMMIENTQTYVTDTNTTTLDSSYENKTLVKCYILSAYANASDATFDVTTGWSYSEGYYKRYIAYNKGVEYLPTVTRVGYTFDSWNTKADGSGSTITTSSTLTAHTSIYAKWIANTNTAYTVKHWQENVNATGNLTTANCTVKDTENLTGITGESVTPAVKTYAGFTSPSTQTVIISADGSTVINYFYKRNTYSVSLTKGTGIASVTGAGTYKYGASVTVSATLSDGYSFNGWTGTYTSSNNPYKFTMPANAVSLTANATINKFTITINVQNKHNDTVVTNETYGTVSLTSIANIPYGSKITISNNVLSVNGTTVTATAKPAGTYPGYSCSFTSWSVSNNDIVTSALTITATFTKTESDNTKYTVVHYIEDLDNTSANLDATNCTIKDTENLTGTTGASVTPAVKTYEGFTTPSTQTVTISADGSTVINYFYKRNTYSVSLTKGTGIASVTGAGTYKYGASVTVSATVSTGYNFNGWTGTYTSSNNPYTFTMPANAVSLTANATIKKYTVTIQSNDTNLGTVDIGTITNVPHGATVSISSNELTLNGVKVVATAKSITGYTITMTWSVANGYKIQGENVVITATFTKTPNTNTAYTVKHWQENIDVTGTLTTANCTLILTENLTGTTGASVTPAVKTYEGFTSPSTQTVTISADGSTVVNYFYTRNSYTVSLTKGTGIASVTGAGTYDYGKEVTVSATVSDGYNTVAWSGTFTTSTFTMPASNVNMTATATPNTYTVVYNKNATNATGTMANSTYTYDISQALRANAFSYTGYTFLGWATSSSGAVQYTNQQSVKNLTTTNNGTVTLYAKWQVNNYNVSYYANGGLISYGDATKFDTGHKIDWSKDLTISIKFSYAGNSDHRYLIAGTYDGENSLNIELQSNKIRLWMNNGQVNLYSSIVPANTEISLVYSWTVSSKTWKINATGAGYSYTNTGTSTISGVSGKGIVLACDHRSNPPFKAINLGDVSITVDSTTTVYSYTVTKAYDSAYGTLPTVTRSGYSFAGWFTEQNGGTEITSTTTMTTASNHTLYARWNRNTATIKLGTLSNVTNVYYGTSADSINTALTTQGFTANSNTNYFFKATLASKDGYTFTFANWSGWFSDTTNPSGAHSFTEQGGTYTVNATATKTANQYTLTVVDNNGTDNRTNYQVTFDSAYPIVTMPTYTGYTLSGLYSAGNSSVKVYNADGSVAISPNKYTTAGNTTVIAQWTQNTATIKLGTISDGISAVYYGTSADSINTELTTTGFTANSNTIYYFRAVVASGYTFEGFTGWLISASTSASNSFTDNGQTYTINASATLNKSTIKLGTNTNISKVEYWSNKDATVRTLSKTGFEAEANVNYTFKATVANLDGYTTTFNGFTGWFSDTNIQSANHSFTENGQTYTINASATRTVNKATVNVTLNGYAYGSANWDSTLIDGIYYGTQSNAVTTTISNGTFTIDAANATALNNYYFKAVVKEKTGYTTSFVKWVCSAWFGEDTSNPSSAHTFKNNATYTLNLEITRTINTFTVTITDDGKGYGSVNPTTVTNVPYGTVLSVDNNKLTVNGTQVVATPKEATAQYTYSFANWNNGTATVTGNITVTANFNRTTNKYSVTISSNNSDYGKVNNEASVSYSVDYGTTISVSGNVITVGSNEVTAIETTDNAQYDYSFAGFTKGGVAITSDLLVTGDVTIIGNFNRMVKTYTVTWKSQDGSITYEIDEEVPYGTSLSYDSATPTKSANAQYTYTFAGWATNVNQESGTSVAGLGQVKGNVTYYAAFSKTVNKYTVTWKNEDGTVLETDVMEYGATPTYNGATPTKPATGEYTYTFANWSPEITVVISDINYVATYNATVNTYTVTINSNNTSYGTVSPLSVGNVPYGSTITFSGTNNRNLVITSRINGEVIETVVATPATIVGYTCALSSWSVTSGTKVTGSLTITATFTKTPNEDTAYTVKHWQENIDVTGTLTTANCTLILTENLTGTTGASVTPAVKTYEGFTSPSTQTVTINADGSTVVNYFYTRNSYTVSLTKGTGIASVTGAGTYDYGKEVTVSATVSAGYTWNKWTGTTTSTSNPYKFTMPANAVSLTANTTTNSYVLSIDPNGGRHNDGSTGIVTVTKLFGESEKISVRVRDGYHLTGYIIKNTLSGSTTDIGGATITFNSSTKEALFNQGYVACTIVAQWIEKEYTITINPNGGTIGENLVNAYSPKGSEDNQINNGNIYYYIDSSGKIIATGLNKSSVDNYGMTHITATLSANETYTSKLWFVTSDGQSVDFGWFKDGQYSQYFWQSVGNNGYFCETTNKLTNPNSAFVEGEYVLRVDPNRYNNIMTINGVVIYSRTTTEAYTKTLPYLSYYALDVPTREGYTFIGWSINGGSNIVETDATRHSYIYQQTSFDDNANITLTAMWEQNTSSIKLGTVNNITKVYYGTSLDNINTELTSAGFIANSNTNYYFRATLASQAGYTFTFANWSGWFGDTTNPSGAHSFTESGSEYIINATANKTPNLDTAYTVNHWIENIDVAGTTYNSTQYTKHSTDNKTGTTDTSLTLTDLDKAITGFTYKLGQVRGTTVSSTTILGDGTRVIDLYYTRNSYTVSLTKGTGIDSVTGAGTYDYGKEVTVSATVSAGYNTVAWSGTFTTSTFTMPASNVNMTATATPNTYTVVYNKNATNATGTMANSTYTYDISQALRANAFSYTGYTFLGWATSSSGAVQYTNQQSVKNLTTTNNGTVTLYAKWNRNTATIKLGTLTNVTNVYYGTSADSITTELVADTTVTITSNTNYYFKATLASQAGYTFTFANWSGWFGDKTNPSGAHSFTEQGGTYTVNATATKTANTNTKYVVNHYTENLGATGTLTASNCTLVLTENLTGTTDTEVTPLVKSYTGFTAPNTQTVIILGNGSTVVNYYYTRNSYTVSLIKGTGISSVSGNGTYKYGASITVRAEVITDRNTGDPMYNWINWTGDINTTENPYTFEMPAHNVSLTANGEIRKFTIIWKNYNGAILETNTDVPYGETPIYNGTIPTKPATAEFTYTFNAWSPAISSVTGDVVYTATFSSVVNEYAVTWMSQDGITVLETDKDIAYGTKPNFDQANPTKPATAQYSYAFAGWNLKSNQESGTAESNLPAITGDTIYYAAFSKTLRSYTITWKNDDGTILETDYNVDFGLTPTYDGTTPSKDNTAQYTYTFIGWDPQVTSVTGNATYTAEYVATINKYTVTWKSQDGSMTYEIDEEVPYGTSLSYDSATPTKSANAQYTYTFAGWATSVNQESGTSVAGLGQVKGNVTYYAAFSKTVNKYTVTWENEDGTVLETDIMEYGATPTYNGATPTKLATAEYTYTFANWNPEITAVRGNITYVATYNATVNTYTVTINSNNTSYGTVSPLSVGNVPYGSTITFSGTNNRNLVITSRINGEVIETVVATPATKTGYIYEFVGWTVASGDKVQGDLSITATFKEYAEITLSKIGDNTSENTYAVKIGDDIYTDNFLLETNRYYEIKAVYNWQGVDKNNNVHKVLRASINGNNSTLSHSAQVGETTTIYSNTLSEPMTIGLEYINSHLLTIEQNKEITGLSVGNKNAGNQVVIKTENGYMVGDETNITLVISTIPTPDAKRPIYIGFEYDVQQGSKITTYSAGISASTTHIGLPTFDHDINYADADVGIYTYSISYENKITRIKLLTADKIDINISNTVIQGKLTLSSKHGFNKEIDASTANITLYSGSWIITTELSLNDLKTIFNITGSSDDACSIEYDKSLNKYILNIGTNVTLNQ